MRARLCRALARPETDSELSVAGVLDLFEEHFYVGEITAEGRYVSVTVEPDDRADLRGPVPPGAEPGALWESMVHADDWPDYLRLQSPAARGRSMARPATASPGSTASPG